MKNTILQHNMVLQNMVIVPIININKNDKEQVKELFESLLHFSGYEPIRKESEGIYLLITNKSVINKAQKEADNLVIFFFGRRQSNLTQNLSEKKKHPLINNQVSSYTSALSLNMSQIPTQSMLYSPSSYKRSISISFTPDPTSLNNSWTLLPSQFPIPTQLSHPPVQKCKV